MSAKPSELRAELRAKILGNLGAAPTRADWKRRSVVAVAVGLAASLALFLAIGGVKLGQRPAVYVGSLAAAWLVLLLVAAPWALARGRSSVGRPSRLLTGLSLGLPLLVLGLVAGAAVLWPETRSILSDGSDVRCFAFALVLGAGPYLSFLWVKRRLVLVHSHVEAAAAGVFAGTMGSFLITLRCDCSELLHLVIGHISPVLVLGALSAILVGRWFARAPLQA